MTHSSGLAGRSDCLGTLPNAALRSESASGGRCSVSSRTPSSPHYLLKFLMSLSLWAHSLPPLRPHLPSPLSDFSSLLHHICPIPVEQYTPAPKPHFPPSLSTTSLQSVTIFSLFSQSSPPSCHILPLFPLRQCSSPFTHSLALASPPLAPFHTASHQHPPLTARRTRPVFHLLSIPFYFGLLIFYSCFDSLTGLPASLPRSYEFGPRLLNIRLRAQVLT